MFEQYSIQIQYRKGQRQVLNALLALATGILTLAYPNFLYLTAGGYLVALGALFLAFRIPPVPAALPIVAGVLILVFPELIPYTFSGFLILFGLLLLASFQFTLMGILTLVIALFTLTNPEWVAYLVAVYLLLYATSNLIRYFRGGNPPHRQI